MSDSSGSTAASGAGRSDGALKRQLGLSAVVALVAGNMLGSGVFFPPGELAAVAQHPWQVHFIWALCGLITLCGALTLLVAARAMRRLRGAATPSPLWDVLPALILAGIPGYACWSSGGLETQLFTLLCTAGATAYLSVYLAEAPTAGLGRAGLLVGLAALTRPEGYLLCGLLGLHRLIVKLRTGASLRERLVPTGGELRFIACFLLLTVPHLLWRRSYYGYWVPNTFYIKSSGGAAAWSQGLYYLLAFARDQKLFVLPILWALGLGRRLETSAERRYLLLGAVTYLWTAAFLLYVVSVGGDFMGLYRFVLPIVPLNVLCGALGLWRLGAGAESESGAPVRGWALGLTALLLGLHAVNAYFVDRHALGFIGADRGIDTPGYLRYYTSDRAAIGKWLGQNVRPDDYQVVGGAGAQVYYAGIRALDSFGLSDAYVAHEVAPVSTRAWKASLAASTQIHSASPTSSLPSTVWPWLGAGHFSVGMGMALGGSGGRVASLLSTFFTDSFMLVTSVLS